MDSVKFRLTTGVSLKTLWIAAKDNQRRFNAIRRMGNNFIHFNRREARLQFPDKPDDPWFAELQPDVAGFEIPKYHVTRANDGPAAEVKPGDTIWLIGQLYAPWGKLPAALDARIEVASCRPGRNQNGFRYSALPSSRWFPLADATAVLSTLHSCRSDGSIHPVIKDANRPAGQFLRRMRRLASAAPLRRWEAELDAKGFDFISYRICDGTRAASEKAQALIAQGIPVFWDRWSLPRRLAERREARQQSARVSILACEVRRNRRVSSRISHIFYARF